MAAVMPSDSLQRFVFEHAAIRGELVHLDQTWRAVLERHEYPPAVRNLLGELMAAAALLSATLKFNGSMILQIQGNGPVGLLVVEATSERSLRGMAQWNGAPQPGGGHGSPLFYTRLDAGAAKFAPQRNLLGETSGLDGGASVTADEKGAVYIVWHGQRGGGDGEAARVVFVLKSSDNGGTFAKPVVANAGTALPVAGSKRITVSPPLTRTRPVPMFSRHD